MNLNDGMDGQTLMRLIGIILWIFALLILLITYRVFALPVIGSNIIKGYFERESMFYSSSLALSVLLLAIGTFLIVYPFKKSRK